MIDEDLISILACPACKGDVKEENSKVLCLKCGRQYPIKDGVPILLVDEALPPSS
ncbi:MAG: Trm112 family protein [Candidatus Omnitrophica bacterium]|nr:Trm112 family protein [Candidatus Omnitrophota bacterium]